MRDATYFAIKNMLAQIVESEKVNEYAIKMRRAIYKANLKPNERAILDALPGKSSYVAFTLRMSHSGVYNALYKMRNDMDLVRYNEFTHIWSEVE